MSSMSIPHFNTYTKLLIPYKLVKWVGEYVKRVVSERRNKIMTWVKSDLTMHLARSQFN